MDLSLERVQRLFEKCHEIAKDSHDINTQVGACLIHKPTRSSVAEGFNGHLRKVCSEALPEEAPDKYRYMAHAEFNVICNAFQTGAVKYSPDQYYLFCTLSPCENCARLLYASGIKEVFFEKMHPMFETYRMDTEHDGPALDIHGRTDIFLNWGASHQNRPYIKGEFCEEDILFYKVTIEPK